MSSEPFKQAARDYVLGVLRIDELPKWAESVLEQADSPALVRLAVSEGDDSEKIKALFRKAMVELGVPMPSPSEAGLMLAREVAQKITNGTVGAYEGAKTIWAQVYVRFPELKQLRPFVGYASEYEDDPRHRKEYLDLIHAECELLLADFNR